MAWFTEQILCDYINRIPNHKIVEDNFRSMLSDDVVMEYGSSVYHGSEQILKFFEDISVACTSDEGFTAKPVIICDTDDPDYGIVASQRCKAIALCSKVEEYISWFFLIESHVETWKICSIRATQGMNYKFYYDYYVTGEYTE